MLSPATASYSASTPAAISKSTEKSISSCVRTKSSDTAGDGTTTATILAQSIYREGVKSVAAGANPMALKRGIEKAVEAIVEEVKKFSKPVNDNATIAQVGTISANGDSTIGNII